MSDSAAEDLLAGVIGNLELEPERAETAEEATTAFLVFRLGPVWYAVNALSVKKVLHLSQPVPVPGTPPFVRGIINIGGQIATLVDLAVLLGAADGGKEPADEGSRRCIVLQVDQHPVAALADEVFGMLEIAPSRIRSAADATSPVAETFTQADRVVAVLNVGRLLAWCRSNSERDSNFAPHSD